MELTLRNVGIIQNSKIKLDGLTVITGKNSSGKTTIGKVLYSIIRAKSNINQAFKQAKRDYICEQLEILRRNSPLPIISRYYSEDERDNSIEDSNQILYSLVSSQYRHMQLEELIDYIPKVRQCLLEMSEKSLDAFLQSYSDEFVPQGDALNEVIGRQFEADKQYYKDHLDSVMRTLQKTTLPLFSEGRIHDFLESEFHNQVQPVRNPDAVSEIIFSDTEDILFDLQIRNKNDYVFTQLNLPLLPFTNSCFIDDPFIMDRLSSFALYRGRRHTDQEESIGQIKSSDIIRHDEHLSLILRRKESNNYFSTVDFQDKYESLILKINSIVPGEFSADSKGFFYVDGGKKLAVENLATGSKMFFIIKQLFVKGYLEKGYVLILDEPESHLHPEWINKFAEILVLLIKETGIKVLLTTHSPNLMLALDVFSREYKLDDNSHFYLAQKIVENEKETGFAEILCIDGKTNEGYAHLSVPLLEMSIRNDALNNEEN